MDVLLPPELNRFVSAKVRSGRYGSANEVICAALRLLEERDREREAQVAKFNDELRTRLASLDRGTCLNPSIVRRQLAENSRQRKLRGR